MTEIGRMVIRLEEVDSTNEYAKELIGQGCLEGTVVLSDIQTGGKGRLARKWESPKGGLWMSICLKPKDGLVGDKLGIIPLLSGCAAARAVSGISDLNARVKWPNDVIINGKKMAGILSESILNGEDRWVVVGIGIDVNNPVQEGYEFSDISTSITEETGRKFDLEKLMVQLICEFERLYNMAESGKDAEVLDEWRGMADTLGKKVSINRISGEITGIARDIDEVGALILELQNGHTETILAGDCQHLE